MKIILKRNQTNNEDEGIYFKFNLIIKVFKI